MDTDLDYTRDTVEANCLAVSSMINESIQELADSAKALTNCYFDEFMRQSGANGNAVGSKMPQLKVTDGSGGLYIEITWIKSVRGVDKSRIRTKYTKGNKPGYTLSKITRGSPDWEVELVTRTEEKFTEIRDLYERLSKMRRSNNVLLNNLKRRNDQEPP